MVERASVYRGCLLGLAAGDAMGYCVDSRNLEEICRDYGPGGLRGYDLVNGYADVSSHTQLAAFAANGLLVGATRGQLRGAMAPYVRYVALAMREWRQAQYSRRPVERPAFWVSRVPELCRRRCMDTRMLDTLDRAPLGTPEEPKNRHSSLGSLVTAVPVGLFFSPGRMKAGEVGRLGAECVALTHGDPMAFLSGAALAYIIAGIQQDGETDLAAHFRQAGEAVARQFAREYPQALALRDLLRNAVRLAGDPQQDPRLVMERMDCDTCAQVLAGAIYAVLYSGGDFDTAMVTAVNHSGRSAAVGAVAGAILGAKLGEKGLPTFYLECLEPADALRTLAEDLALDAPLGGNHRLFDDDWDQKYTQGQVVDRYGWYEE